MVLGIKFPAEWIHKIIQPKVMKLMNFGGESGPGARPIRQEWVTEIRDKRLRANVPFFFKQWGEMHTCACSMFTGERREQEEHLFNVQPRVKAPTICGVVLSKRDNSSHRVLPHSK